MKMPKEYSFHIKLSLLVMIFTASTLVGHARAQLDLGIREQAYSNVMAFPPSKRLAGFSLRGYSLRNMQAVLMRLIFWLA